MYGRKTFYWGVFYRYIHVYCTKFTGRKIKSVLQGKNSNVGNSVILNFSKCWGWKQTPRSHGLAFNCSAGSGPSCNRHHDPARCLETRLNSRGFQVLFIHFKPGVHVSEPGKNLDLSPACALGLEPSRAFPMLLSILHPVHSKWEQSLGRGLGVGNLSR